MDSNDRKETVIIDKGEKRSSGGWNKRIWSVWHGWK